MNIKQLDQSNWVCYQLPNKSYYYGQVGYLDQSGIVNPKDNQQAANNPKNKLVKHGFGIYFYNIAQQGQKKPEFVYQGNWDRDNKCGKGKIKYFKAGKQSTYQGMFLEDHYHGNGKMTFKNGDIYQGLWKRSKMDGAGVFKHHDGFILKGIFKANYFIDEDVLRNPLMPQKQYLSFKKQRKQIIKQKQKRQKVKDGFICKIQKKAQFEKQIKQKIQKSTKNNRIPLILSSKSKAINYTLNDLINNLKSQFNVNINIFDLRKAYNLQGEQKYQYRQQIHRFYRNSLINGQIFIISLDESQMKFEQMFYPDIKQFYDSNGFNSISWSRDQLMRKQVKNKIQGLKEVHQNYKLIVWTKFKVDKTIKEDFLRDKLQSRFQKILPFIKIDSILVVNQQKNAENNVENQSKTQ